MKNKNGVNRKYLVIPKAYLLEKRVQNTQNVARKLQLQVWFQLLQLKQLVKLFVKL